MFARIKETLLFFRGNFIPISLIVLPFVVPLNIISGLFYAYLPAEEVSFLTRNIPTVLGLLVYPLYTGALIWFFSRIVFLDNWEWNLRECLSVGLKVWPQLFTVSVFCFLLILIGLMAFIVPGLILIARLAFAEFLVVLEGSVAADAVKKSVRLTKPFQKDIIGSFLIFFVTIMGLQWGVFFLLETVFSGGLIMAGIAETAFSLMRTLLDILFFRFYCLHLDLKEDVPTGA